MNFAQLVSESNYGLGITEWRRNSEDLWAVVRVPPAYGWPSQSGFILENHQTSARERCRKAVWLLGPQKTTLHWTLRMRYRLQSLCVVISVSIIELRPFSVLSVKLWNSTTTSGSRQWGTKQNKKIPTKAANKTSAHYAEIALACRSLVISFVSNVLIVTDYMLLSSPWHLLYSGIDFCAPVWKGHFDQCSVIGTKLGSYQVILLFNDEILKNSMGRLQALKCTLNLL